MNILHNIIYYKYKKRPSLLINYDLYKNLKMIHGLFVTFLFRLTCPIKEFGYSFPTSI